MLDKYSRLPFTHQSKKDMILWFKMLFLKNDKFNGYYITR